jgi:hypothetical protein
VLPTELSTDGARGLVGGHAQLPIRLDALYIVDRRR